MRKLLFAAILSLAGVGLTAERASAWFFLDWFHCHNCCKGATLCIKPYNAFTPSVFGSIVADGCFPVALNQGGMYPCMGNGQPCFQGNGGCGFNGVPGEVPVINGNVLPSGDAAVPQALPSAPPPAPMAAPGPMPAPTTTSQAWQNWIQAANYYRGMYYPPYGFAPQVPRPPMPNLPAYSGYPGYYGYPAYTGHPGYPGYGR
jgi:hypothetical protein